VADGGENELSGPVERRLTRAQVIGFFAVVVLLPAAWISTVALGRTHALTLVLWTALLVVALLGQFMRVFTERR
jgi:uncharacterized membrane protein